MFTFQLPTGVKNVWKLCFRDKAEMKRIFYEDRIPEDGMIVNGITDFNASTIFLEKSLDGFLLAKTLRHELMHAYLWETGQQGRDYSEEEMCDIVSVASPIINKTADDILLRLKEGLYKHGE